MVDDIKLEIPYDPPIEFRQKISAPFSWNGITFTPDFHKNGDVISYSGKLDNLYVKMISGKIILMNSLHKYYHGDNYSDFTAEDIKHCMEMLSEIFGEVFWDARITKLTAAVNFHCDASLYVKSLISFKGNPMEPMRPRNSAQVYGKRFASTHYNIKVYDKQFEVKKEDRLFIEPTLRIEKEMNMNYFHKRRLNPIHIYTPRDLIQSNVVDFLSFELYDLIDSLGFDYGIDPISMENLHDSNVVIYMSNPYYRKVLRKTSNYRTVKSYEKRLEELKNEFTRKDFKQSLTELLDEKIHIRQKESVT